MFFSLLQSRFHQLDIFPRCRLATLGLFLKGVENIYGIGKPDRINGAVCPAPIILNNLKDASAAEALKRFRTGMLFPVLSVIQRLAHDAANRSGKCAQITQGRANPVKRFNRPAYDHI